MSAEAKKTIVVDLGSFTTKLGFSGDKQPTIHRSCFGQRKSLEEKSNQIIKYYGNDAIDMIHASAKKKIVESKHANIQNLMRNSEFYWNDYNDEFMPFMQCVINDHCNKDNENNNYDKYYSTNPLLLSEQSFCSRKNRLNISELMFETLDSPGIYFELPAILGLYSTGRLNGCVVDIGHQSTSIVPIIDGYAIEYAIDRSLSGGHDVSVFFNHLLRKSGVTLHTKSQLEYVASMKEKVTECSITYTYRTLNDDEEINCVPYQMPDGTILQIGSARYRSPEILFEPNIIGKQMDGIHKRIINVVNNCNLDLRHLLFADLTLIGGTSKLKNLPKRLINEICNNDRNIYQRNAKKKTKLRIRAPLNREISSWIGGSILGEIDEFKNLLITKEKYKEHGANVVFRM